MMDVLSDDELRHLSETPTLFLIGENEKIYSAPRAVQRIREVAPRIRVDVVPGAGHLLTATHAAHVNDRVSAFLNDT